MYRTLIAIFTTLVLGGAALLSCSERSSAPSEIDRSIAGSGVAENNIQEVINSIFGRPGGQLTAANSRWKNVQKACPPGPSTTPLDCQTQVFQFITVINDKLAGGKLKATPTDPAGGVEIPETTAGAAFLLQLLLLQYAGFDISGIDPNADPENQVVVICDPAAPCEVLIPSLHSGVFLPVGACDAPCVIIGQKIDETVFNPGEGPLTGLNGGDLDQFPLFFSWSKQELGEGGGGGPAASRGLELAQGDFNVPVEIALCVVEEGPYAPPDSVVENRLQLAHPNPADPDTIEILDVNAANNVNLDCSDATAGDPPSEPIGGLAPAGERRLTLASPGKLGAAITAFSPFAAVDPQSGEPGSIAGTVSDACSGGEIAIGGATVELFEGTIGIEETPFDTTSTDAQNGSYSFADVPVGSYTVRASEESYSPNTAEVTVSSGQESTADIRLTPTFGCLT